MLSPSIPDYLVSYLYAFSSALLSADSLSLRAYLKSASQRANRRSRKWSLVEHFNLSSPILLSLFSASDWTCLYCGCPLFFQRGALHPSLDHIVPLARGGSNTPANLCPCCVKCNEQKQNHCHLNFCTDLDGFAVRYGKLWTKFDYFLSPAFAEDEQLLAFMPGGNDKTFPLTEGQPVTFYDSLKTCAYSRIQPVSLCDSVVL